MLCCVRYFAAVEIAAWSSRISWTKYQSHRHFGISTIPSETSDLTVPVEPPWSWCHTKMHLQNWKKFIIKCSTFSAIWELKRKTETLQPHWCTCKSRAAYKSKSKLIEQTPAWPLSYHRNTSYGFCCIVSKTSTDNISIAGLIPDSLYLVWVECKIWIRILWHKYRIYLSFGLLELYYYYFCVDHTSFGFSCKRFLWSNGCHIF